MKKLISLTAALTLAVGIIPPSALAEYEDAEIFQTDVYYLKQSEYDNVEQNFTTISLKDVVNNGYEDETASDNMGGWTDEGSGNDMRHFDLKGITYLKGVPFDLVDPDENDGKAVVTCAGRGATFVPDSVDIPIGNKAVGLYILHASAWNYGTGDKKGEYTLVYDDGTSAKIELFENVNIHNFWGAADYATSQCVWKGNHPTGGQENAIGMIAVSNPYPEKMIKTLNVKSMDGGAKSWLFVLGVTLTDVGPYMIDMGIVDLDNPSTGSWLQSDANYSIAAGSALDASNLLEKPAGKHGTLKADGDNFVFEDGTGIKFWGINLPYTDSLADKNTADKIADDIARMGNNIVRIKIDPMTADDTQIDAVMYMTAKLKENGVYTYFAFDGDDLNRYFDEELIQKQKDGIKNLLCSTNKYTGMKLAEDPTVAMLEFMPTSLYYFKAVVKTDVNEAELQKLFNEYLKKKYGTTAKLKSAWQGNGRHGDAYITLNDDEKLEDGSVTLDRFWRMNLLYSDNRNLDIRKFFETLQLEYYADMKNYAESLGYKGLATCNSNPLTEEAELGDAYLNSQTDFVARNSIHAYNYNGDDLSKPVYFNQKFNASLTENSLGIIGNLSRFKYKDTPYIVSEWNSGWVNQNIGEDYAIMAFMGARQNWNPIAYSYMTRDYSTENVMTGLYDMYNNPVSRVSHVGAARLFRAVEEAGTELTVKLNEEKTYLDTLRPWYMNIMGNKMSEYINEDKFSNFYKYKTSYEFEENANDVIKPPQKMIYNDDESRIDLINGEMYIVTDKAEAFACRNVTDTADLRSVELNIENAWYTAMLTSVNDKPLADETNMLLTLTSSVRNKGYSFSDNYINSKGKSPVIMQPVQGTAKIKLDGDFDVYSLSSDGKRVNKLNTYKNSNGQTVFKVNEYSYANDTRSLSFEIIKK